MKSNLDSFFKTSKEVETEGYWAVISDKIAFRLKRFGGFNSTELKAAMAKYYKPFAKQVELQTISSEKEREILVKTFVDVSVIDWRGVEIDGKEETFSKEKCVDLLMSLPDLCETLMQAAQKPDNYKEDLGNS